MSNPVLPTGHFSFPAPLPDVYHLASGAPFEAASVTDDAVLPAVTALFLGIGVSDRESYLAWRAAAKAGLREAVTEIRRLKTALHPLDGNSREFWKLREDLQHHWLVVTRITALRRVGKVWSAEMRRRGRAAMAA
jgi:hypothetical protein